MKIQMGIFLIDVAIQVVADGRAEYEVVCDGALNVYGHLVRVTFGL